MTKFISPNENGWPTPPGHGRCCCNCGCFSLVPSVHEGPVRCKPCRESEGTIHINFAFYTDYEDGLARQEDGSTVRAEGARDVEIGSSGA